MYILAELMLIENKSILKDACYIIHVLMKHLEYNITVLV